VKAYAFAAKRTLSSKSARFRGKAHVIQQKRTLSRQSLGNRNMPIPTGMAYSLIFTAARYWQIMDDVCRLYPKKRQGNLA